MNWPSAYSVTQVSIPGVPAANDLGRVIFVPEYVSATTATYPTVFVATAGKNAPYYLKPAGSQPPFGTNLNLNFTGRSPLPNTTVWTPLLITGVGAEITSPTFSWTAVTVPGGASLVDAVSPSARYAANMAATYFNASSIAGRRSLLLDDERAGSASAGAAQKALGAGSSIEVDRSAKKARRLLWRSNAVKEN